MQKKIAVLGSTGSIGVQTLDVAKNLKLDVVALSANANTKTLAEQARRWRVKLAVIADKTKYSELKLLLADTDIQVKAGADCIAEAAALDECDIVVNAIVGIAGLRPTMAAVSAGKTLALANKESLVTGGGLVMETAKKHGATILPIDSEHSAIFQSLRAGRREELRGIILTASGGPFCGFTKKQLADVTLEDALKHPNWSMGNKITIDSATLMNKGLEFIEAVWLFDLKPEQIEVVIHRQSVLHSAVEFVDGSVIAQLSVPDMRGAIQYSITHPQRFPLDIKRLSLSDYNSLTFEKPDTDTFRCLSICIDAIKKGGLAPCVVNGAGEEATLLFLEGKIKFLEISQLIDDASQRVKTSDTYSLKAIEDADMAAREFVRGRI